MAVNELNKQKAKFEQDFAEILEIGIELPAEFFCLNDPEEQARWLFKELDDYSAAVVTDTANPLLPVFERFYLSLPVELRHHVECVVSTDDLPFAEITDSVVILKRDESIVVDGLFHDGPRGTPVKIKLRRKEFTAAVKHEFNVMEKFHRHASAVVATPFAIVQPSEGTLKKCSSTFIDGNLSEFVGIVLERGTLSMAQYLTKPDSRDPNNQRSLFIAAVKIVEAAHRNSIVWLDCKPENIVHCIYDGVGVWKAIDFGTSRYVGKVVARVATPQYASYELARHILDASSASLLADPAMDICSLGWTAWKIFNNGVSFWDSQGIIDHQEILAALATMTQSQLIIHVNEAFPSSGSATRDALRNFLPKVMHVDPRCRLAAHQLRTATSLLGEKDFTFNFGALVSVVNNRFDQTDSKLVELSQEVRSAWSTLEAQLSDRMFAKSLSDGNATEAVVVLGRIADMLEQQRADAQHTGLSMANIAHSLGSLTDTILPSIRAIIEDNHDQTMSELQKLDGVVDMMREMKLQLNEVVLCLQRTQLCILNHMQQLGYNFPSTFIIIPQRQAGPTQPRSFLKTMRAATSAAYDSCADKLFSTLYLFFYCPVTGKLVPSGDGGNGYVLRSLKPWAKQLVPMVKMGLLIAKVVLATQGGLGGLVPNFPYVNKNDLDNILRDVVADGREKLSKVADKVVADSFEADVLKSLTDDVLDSIVQTIAHQVGAGSQPDAKAYCPRRCGLERATYLPIGQPSTSAWVSEEGKAAFLRDGPDAFRKVA